MRTALELRHLRYFIAVVEEGSLTVAAEQRLHTSQPSLSRQIRDLEEQVGATLLNRSARGIALTAAGEAFLEHTRLALAQVDAAVEAARRAAQPAKQKFAMGFLTGQEMDWLPEAMHVLKGELCNIDVTVSSQYSPELADGLLRGRLDVAFLRPETGYRGLEYKLVIREPLVVILSSDHALASREAIDVTDLANETFIGVSDTAPSLRAVIDTYLQECGLQITPAHAVDNLAMATSLVSSTRGVALLPAYARNFLPWSVTSRPLRGNVPTIDLVIGYSQTNHSPVLKMFLAQVDTLIERVARKTPLP
jgi:LysR family hca operon transcriptional activator